MSKIISIDGPSGSGKTTIAKLLASKLNSEYISTGALYRSLSYLYINEGKELSYIFDNLNIKSIDNQNIQVNEKMVLIKDLYTKEITDYTSKLSQRVDIRDIVTNRVREYVKDKDIHKYICTPPAPRAPPLYCYIYIYIYIYATPQASVCQRSCV